MMILYRLPQYFDKVEELFISAVRRTWGFSDVKQTEIQTAEALLPEPSSSEVDMAIDKLKRHKPPRID